MRTVVATPIRLKFSTVDGFVEYRSYKSLEGAKRYARKRLGENYDFGSSYAVDMFGTGKLEILSGNTSFEALMEKS